jgi:hypothetical protein
MPSFYIVDGSVVRFMPSLAAAPNCTVKYAELNAEILAAIEDSPADPFCPG